MKQDETQMIMKEWMQEAWSQISRAMLVYVALIAAYWIFVG